MWRGEAHYELDFLMMPRFSVVSNSFFSSFSGETLPALVKAGGASGGYGECDPMFGVFEVEGLLKQCLVWVVCGHHKIH